LVALIGTHLYRVDALHIAKPTTTKHLMEINAVLWQE